MMEAVFQTVGEEIFRPAKDKVSKMLDRAYNYASYGANYCSGARTSRTCQPSFIMDRTSSELHAIAVETNKRELDKENITDIELIVAVCAGLVVVDEESDIIRLVHYTTQEFFERTWGRWFPDSHTDITKTCVTYLSFRQFETGFSTTREDLTS